MRIKLPVLVFLALAFPGGATAQTHQSLDVRVAAAPDVVRVGAADQLVYELHLTNFSSLPLRLDQLVINPSGTDAPLKVYAGDELAKAIALVGPAVSRSTG